MCTYTIYIYRVAETHRMSELVIVRKRATNYRALLRKMRYEEKTFYESTPLCKCHKRTTNYRALLQQMTYKRSASFMCLIYHKRTTNYRALLQKMTCKRNVLFMCLVYVQSGEDSRTHRMPYLHRSFSAKEPYHHWLFCRKETCNLRHPMHLCHPVVSS